MESSNPKKPVRATCYVPLSDQAKAARGLVILDPDKCIACGICSEVCPPRVISLNESDGVFTWEYTPADCTFCKLCVRSCPSEALSQEADRPSREAQDAAPTRMGSIPIPPCASCGKPYMPAPPAVLGVLFGSVAQQSGLPSVSLGVCPACRKRTVAASLSASVYRKFSD